MKLTPDGGDASKQTHYHRMETNKKTYDKIGWPRHCNSLQLGFVRESFFYKGVESGDGTWKEIKTVLNFIISLIQENILNVTIKNVE